MYWHELVLNGVGGRTVAEAKATMSYSEFLRWCLFREQAGSLHPGLRIDRAIARALAVWTNAHSKGRRFKESEFSPYDGKPHSADIDDPESVLDLLKGLSNGVTRDTNT